MPEFSEKVDIYALGLILLEMSTNIDQKTKHEKITTFDLLKQQRRIKSTNNLDNTIEKELIIALTEEEPVKRPSATHIRDFWLPKWH